jgi:large subunit ribosomal protein L3
MPKTRNPRRGSLAYWPRKRAAKEVPRLRAVTEPKEAKLNAFPGYKVGMTTVQFIDNKKTSPTKNELIAKPATIIECPPLKIFSVRYYRNTAYGVKLVAETLNPKLDKELARSMVLAKKKHAIKDKLDDVDFLRLVVYTQPKLTTSGKKKPELFELPLGSSKEDQLNFAKSNMEKEIDVKSVFSEGQLLDVHGVTKGKGLQGPIKRYGMQLKSHKSEKSRRYGVLAAEGDAKVRYFAHMSGKMGYHLRTEHNKWIIKIVDDVKSFAHFKHYGNVRNTVMLVKGSVPGPSKRLLIFTDAKRPDKHVPKQAPEIRAM